MCCETFRPKCVAKAALFYTRPEGCPCLWFTVWHLYSHLWSFYSWLKPRFFSAWSKLGVKSQKEREYLNLMLWCEPTVITDKWRTLWSESDGNSNHGRGSGKIQFRKSTSVFHRCPKEKYINIYFLKFLTMNEVHLGVVPCLSSHSVCSERPPRKPDLRWRLYSWDEFVPAAQQTIQYSSCCLFDAYS